MVKTCFPIKGVRVQSLIRELRFHLPEGQEKKKKNRDSIVTNSIMTLKMVHIKKKPLKKGSKFRREKNTNINSFFKTSHNVPFNYMLMVHSSAKILKIIYSL